MRWGVFVPVLGYTIRGTGSERALPLLLASGTASEEVEDEKIP